MEYVMLGLVGAVVALHIMDVIDDSIIDFMFFAFIMIFVGSYIGAAIFGM